MDSATSDEGAAGGCRRSSTITALMAAQNAVTAKISTGAPIDLAASARLGMWMHRHNDASQTKTHTCDGCGDAASPTVGNRNKGNKQEYQNATYAEDSDGRGPSQGECRELFPRSDGLAS